MACSGSNPTPPSSSTSPAQEPPRSPAQTLVIATAANNTPSTPSVVEPIPPDPPAATNLPSFAEDSEPLVEQEVHCAGKCISPFRMAVMRKDDRQLAARVRYCAKKTSIRLSDIAVRVQGDVDAAGRVHHPEVLSDLPISDRLVRCIRETVEQARFNSQPPSRRLYAEFPSRR